ncbi:MAG: helix-turn-helix domain-containing protein [Pirellulaceae bacterium]|nr:helix-turn-helix domain-containing protein [Pirellulaceae bacterium]
MPSDTPTTRSVVPRVGLTREEAAEAMSVSARTIDTLIADRTSGFPVCRIGTRVVIPIRELAEWLAQQARGA